MTYPTAAMLVAGALSPFYNWLLVHHLDWGLTGAALANDAVQVGWKLVNHGVGCLWPACGIQSWVSEFGDVPRQCCHC